MFFHFLDFFKRKYFEFFQTFSKKIDFFEKKIGILFSLCNNSAEKLLKQGGILQHLYSAIEGE